MRIFYELIKADYLQRTRSYGFLVTLAISLLAAYYFVPMPGATYTTVRFGDYVGNYNAAWIGCVTALMSSVFIAMFGFYLINNSIKRDITTGVGVIAATTKVSNFTYLLTKCISNFLVLLSIMVMVMVMAVFLVITRGADYPFAVIPFLLPYLLVTLPCMFVIAVLATAAEVIFRKNQILQNIAYFIVFCFVMSSADRTRGQESTFDFFGQSFVSNSIQHMVQQNYNTNATGLAIGFQIHRGVQTQYFQFDGISWTQKFIFSRLLLILYGLGLIWLCSFIFHRFRVRERPISKKTPIPCEEKQSSMLSDTMHIASLPPIAANYTILPLIKTELLLLLKKGPKWFWLANIGLMISLFFSQITTAHQIILPLLWALQINRWSDLFTKDETHMVHYFTYSAYQPLKRLMTARIIAAVVLAVLFASPLIMRCAAVGNIAAAVSILEGALLLITASLFFGILTGGSKLFEVLLIFFTYGNLNHVPFMDYFGGLDTTAAMRLQLLVIISILFAVGFVTRKYKLNHI